MAQYTKEQAIRIVYQAVSLYDQVLVNKNILFILSDKHKNISSFEVSFRKYHFKHLTGLDPYDRIPSNKFYIDCLERRLNPKDISFAKNGTTQMKLEVLPYIMSKNLGASMVGNFNGTRFDLYTEKLVGGIYACVGFVSSKNDCYVPNTLLNIDIRQGCSNPFRIIAAYRKPCDDKKYSELVYKAKKIDWGKITYPPEFSYLPKPE